jgi:hypothetical protein
MRRELVTSVVAAVLLGGCAGSLVNHRPTDAALVRAELRQNKQAALAAARTELATLRLRRGAVPVSAVKIRFGLGPDGLISPNELDVTRSWREPGGMDSAIAWVNAHPPAGIAPSGEGNDYADRGNVETSAYSTFSFAPRSGRVFARQLVVTASRPRGAVDTVLKVDAEAVWQIPRDHDSLIPADVTRLAIIKTEQGTQGKHPTSKVISRRIETGRPQVHRLVEFLNSLAVDQGIPNLGCELNLGETRIDLRRANARLLAIATFDSCGYVQLAVGKVHTLLIEGLPSWNNSSKYQALIQELEPPNPPRAT